MPNPYSHSNAQPLHSHESPLLHIQVGLPIPPADLSAPASSINTASAHPTAPASTPPTIECVSTPQPTLPDQKQPFIALLRAILREDTILPHEIAATLSGPLVEITHRLHRALAQQGLPDFWRIYHLYGEMYPILLDWRVLIDPSLAMTLPPPPPSAPLTRVHEEPLGPPPTPEVPDLSRDPADLSASAPNSSSPSLNGIAPYAPPYREAENPEEKPLAGVKEPVGTGAGVLEEVGPLVGVRGQEPELAGKHDHPTSPPINLHELHQTLINVLQQRVASLSQQANPSPKEDLAPPHKKNLKAEGPPLGPPQTPEVPDLSRDPADLSASALNSSSPSLNGAASHLQPPPPTSQSPIPDKSRQPSLPSPKSPAQSKPAIGASASAPTGKPPIGTRVSDVQDVSLQWLWKPRLPIGKIIMLDGAPGLGKSLLLLDLIARVTTGRPMPDGAPCLPGRVLLINSEDGLADTIKPRLVRAGADISRVISLGLVPDRFSDGRSYQRPFHLSQDLLKLAEALALHRPRLLVIDPLTAIAIGHDLSNETSVRKMLEPIQALVEHFHVACVIVRHLTKNASVESLLYRGTGSIALIGVARGGFVVARDPYDETRCLLVHTKNNLGKHMDALTYRVLSDEADDRPYILWGESINISEYELLSRPPKEKPSSATAEVLQLLTEHSPNPLSVSTIVKELGLQRNTIDAGIFRLVRQKKIKKHLTQRGHYYVETTSALPPL
ncbi:MAG TPA: AAA family ATPase [Ktedonosporobacter sp.]|nr:AAA family ATPase [Ktedonosporobacter sp.]